MAEMIVNAHINQETLPPQTIEEQAIEMASPDTRNAGSLSITTTTTSRRREFSEIAGQFHAYAYIDTSKKIITMLQN